MDDRLILVGQIGAAHGIRGEVRVKSFTAPADAIADYGPLTATDRKGRSTVLTVDRLRDQGNVLVVKFVEVADRTAAEALNGTTLAVDRSALPEPEDEETFYHADLIGLPAVDADGTVHGVVVAIQDFGAGDLLEIAPEGGKSVYLPFTKAFAPTIDLAQGRIVIAPPEGLFGGGSDDAAAEAEARAAGADGVGQAVSNDDEGRNGGGKAP